MTDFASIGIQLDSRPVAEGTKALDALGASAAAMEPKVDSATKAAGALVEASANVWRRGGDATKAVDALGESSNRTGQKITVSNGQMADTAKILQAQAEQARAAAAGNATLGASTAQLTLGQQQLIEKFREQAATIGMSRAQLMAYQAAQMGLTTQTQQAITAVKAHEDAIKAAAKAKDDAAKSANQLNDALKLLASGYAMLKIGEYIKDSALLAARYETLGVVMEVVGRNAGYTKTQMDAASEGIARQGITMIESRESAVKLVQAHVDLRYAEGLARIAQNAAVIGHMNSSEAFDRLVNGIARGNVLILRNIGINVNLQSAYREMADTLGKTTKELTENERVEARRIAVFERGADINDVYTKSMDTAGKQILSMQRYTQDFKTTFGETFNEVLTISVMALTDHLKDSNKAITDLSKNNQLEEWGHNLTSIFVTLANQVGNAYTTFQKFDTFARHMDAKKSINEDFDAQSKANSDAGAPWGDKAIYEREQKIEARRKAALAQENVDYVTHQAELSGNFDRFARAAAEREAARTAKHKAEADARLKVDADYAKAATDILLKSANEGAVAQAAAGKKVLALYNATYVGTPNYRDTEGRPPKDKIDQAENTRMADHLKRLETEAAAEKASAEFMMRIDEMRHKAGEMGDQEFYARRRGFADEIAGAEISSYNKQLDALKKHHNNTEAEAASNAKAIHDTQDKLAAAKAKFGYDDLTRDEEDRLRQKAMVSASDDAANKYISSLNAQVAAIELANGKRQQSASAMAEEAAAQFRLAAAAMAAQAAGPTDGGHTQADADAAKAMLATLLLQADAQERIAAALRDGEAAAASRKLADQAIRDWRDVGQNVAESLSSAFGTAGRAAGQMFKAYAESASKQLQLNKELAIAKTLRDDDPQKLKVIDDIHRQSATAQLKSYGDMADAAQGFFDAGSRGYQAMDAASKVLHASEVALSLIKGVNAVLTQGEGDPYSAFARMAAMGALVAGLGVAISGGGGSGGGQSAADVQKTQGTGSVFGDSTAKSDSITRSIALASANSSIELTYTAGMLAALKNIEASMSGLTNLIARTNGVTDAGNMGIQTGTLSQGPGGFVGTIANTLSKVPLIGGLIGGLSNLWGKTTQNVVDSGLQFGGSVRSLQSGQGYNQYASVDTTKSSWFGLSKSTSNSVQTQGISNELSSQFGLIFTNLGEALSSAAVALDGNAEDVSKALDNLTIDTTKVSLKGLSGEALTQALNGVISKTMDQMAEAAFPSFDSFRKVGEGYAETVIRVATDYSKLDSALQGAGMTFGAVGMSSIAAREKLIDLAGGIDKLAGQATSFAENYLTQAERLAPVSKYVTDALSDLGLAGIDTRDKFKAVVMGIDKTTVAGQQEYVALMGLADAFAKTHAATVDLTKSQQEIADERRGLQDELDKLTMSSTQLLTKQRNALDASNRGLFDQIQAAQKLKDAQDAAKTSLGDTITKMKSFADATKAYSSGLVTGSLSTLTPMQQYAEMRKQLDANIAASKKGDAAAQGNYQSLATAFLTASQKINGGDSQYSSDFAGVLQTTDELSKWAAGQVDVAQASLDALNAQVIGISDLNTTMQDVAQAVDDLPAAFAAAPAVVMPAPVSYFSTLGTANTESLVAEVKALREEVKGLRADQQKQTGDSIGVAAQVQQDAAQTIVDGVGGAIARAASIAQKASLE